MSDLKHFIKNLDKNAKLVAIAVIGVIIVGALIFGSSDSGFSLSDLASKLGLGGSNKAIAEKAIKYINDNQLSQSTATLVGDVTEESGLVKFKISIGTNQFDSYATKDGKLLFPQAFAMADEKNNGSQNQNANTDNPSASPPKQTAADIKKVDKPLLEAYLVTRCPFGLQMQRVMASAISGAPSLEQYLKVRYMGSVSSDGKTITAMHGEAEAAENLRQICIREEQPAKYWSYVSCQMKAANTEVSCEKSTGVDSAKLNSCVSDPERGIAYAREDFDLTNKYNVTGSPTLILGGDKVSEFDFGGRSPEAIKSVVCAAFNSQPGFCSTKLDTNQAPASFSLTSAGSVAAAGNSGVNGANCAPAQ